MLVSGRELLASFTGAVTALVALLAAGTAMAQPSARIRVSYQPATYWSLPFYVAKEKGFWAAEGLEPEFSTFPSGRPQIEAGAAGGWDVGGVGSPSALFGAVRYGLYTIGLTNDESAANAVMVRGDAASTWYRRPRDLKGRTVLVTALSSESTCSWPISSRSA